MFGVTELENKSDPLGYYRYYTGCLTELILFLLKLKPPEPDSPVRGNNVCGTAYSIVEYDRVHGVRISK